VTVVLPPVTPPGRRSRLSPRPAAAP